MITKHLTVMFTDIKGFTDKSSHKTREELLHLLEDHERLIRPIFERFGGSVVKTIGDAFLVTFESPTNAVLCGMEIQKILRAHNQTAHEETRIEVRVAINSGEVTVKDGDVFGEPVNIAARIEGIAEVNEVYFTEAVYLAMNKREIPSAEVGFRHLKGIPNEVKVYKVLQESREKQNAIPRTRFLRSDKNRARTSAADASWIRWVAIVWIFFFIIGLLSRDAGFLRVLIVFGAYAYLGTAFQTLAQKAKTPHTWLAWIPLANVFYWNAIARKPWHWYVLYVIPGVNIIFMAATWTAIAEMNHKPWWLGLLILVPFVNLILPGYLAFSKESA